MTSFSRTNSRRASVSRRGFTLVEMLVVIGIMLLLIGLALPMITAAYKKGVRARMQADLQVIAAGIDAYRADFKDIPRTDPADSVWGGSSYSGHLRGASTLCWALVAPGNAVNSNGIGQDGADGPGFRIRTAQGQIYGPYINPDRLKIGIVKGGTPGDDHYYYLADADGLPYLYFPANTGATITAAHGYIGSTSANQTPMFDTDDNDMADPFTGSTGTSTMFVHSSDTSTLWLERFQAMLGDTNFDGMIDNSETAKSTGPYILWGLGPDGIGGPDTPTNAQSIATCDDVTNFQ